MSDNKFLDDLVVGQVPGESIPLDVGTENLNAILESRANKRKSMRAPFVVSGCCSEDRPSPGTVIYEKNGTYVLTLVPNEVSMWAWPAGFPAALTIWLRQRTEDETIVLRVENAWMSKSDVVWFDDVIMTLMSLLACKAKIVFVIDSFVEGLASVFALAADEIQVDPSGAITFMRLMPPDAQRPGNLVHTKFASYLMERAIELKLLTQEEVESLDKKNAIVYLSPTELTARMTAPVPQQDASKPEGTS